MKLLILDLDETLFYATKSPLRKPYDFRQSSYYVYKRPHLERFLNSCFRHFKVAVWTSASKSYAASMVEEIFDRPDKLKFVWSRNRCTRVYDHLKREYFWIKRLDKLKQFHPIDQMIMVDNTPKKLIANFENLVKIKSFYGRSDNELKYLWAYLAYLNRRKNIRKIDKRFWRRQIRAAKKT